MNSEHPNNSNPPTNVFRSTSRSTLIVSSEDASSKLVRIGDGFAGETFPLVQHVNTIGRVDTSTILLSHKSISRNHAQILRDGNIHRLIDLHSSNGTFVNGKRIEAGKLVDLQEDQIVQFGNVEFVFVPIDKSINPRNYTSLNSQSLLFAAVALLALLVIVSIAISIILFSTRKEEKKNEPAPVVSQQEKTQKLVSIGKQQLEDGNWRGAMSTFETVISLLPNHKEAAKLRQRAQLEIEAEQIFERAGSEIEKGDLEKARLLLIGVPSGTRVQARAKRQLPILEDRLATKYIVAAEALADENTVDSLLQAHSELVKAASVDRTPLAKSIPAIKQLEKRFKKKRLTFVPIKLAFPPDES